MEQQIQELYYKGVDVSDVAVVIAGNDMYWGPDYCKEQLDKIMEWNPTIYTAIPISCFVQSEKAFPDEHQNYECQECKVFRTREPTTIAHLCMRNEPVQNIVERR